MTVLARPLALTIVLVLLATGAEAQTQPGPFGTVPEARAAQAAERGVTNRVFGGSAAEDGEYPFQVALLRADMLTPDRDSQYDAEFCGGSLIAPNWVLTAAHCVFDYGEILPPGAVTILAGSTDLMAGTRLSPTRIIAHEAYDQRSLDHDIALIELAEPAAGAPVALDFDATPVDSAIVIGWGLTESGDYPRYLLESRIEVVPNAACNSGIRTIYAKAVKEAVARIGSDYGVTADNVDRVGDELAQSIADPLTERMLCAGIKAGGRDSCYGDSGGPLVAVVDGRPLQLGIVSWGEGPADAEIKCGHEDVYGVYSRVASFKDWITTHIGP